MNETRVIRFIATKIFFHSYWHGFIDHVVNVRARFLGIDDFIAPGVNDLALHVHDVVEIESPFSDEIVALLDPLLRCLNGFVQPPMLKLLTFLKSEAFHDFCHAIGGAEVPHQIVFKTHVKPRCAGVALACAASAQLPIDPPGLVALGADDH